jgi:hypothetical protein
MPIEPRNFSRSFDARIGKANVSRITVHGTRKTCGSLLATLDVHPRVAMQILRHSKIAVTMEIYTEVPSADTREALRKLGGVARQMNPVAALCCCTKIKDDQFRDQNRPLTCGGAMGSRTPDLLHAMQIRVFSDQARYSACLRLPCLDGSGGVPESAGNG